MTGSEGAKPDATSRGKGFEERPPLLPADMIVRLTVKSRGAVIRLARRAHVSVGVAVYACSGPAALARY